MPHQPNSRPPDLKDTAFFADDCDGRDEALATFWHVMNDRLSDVA